MDNNQDISVLSASQSFWRKPEGVTGLIFLIGVLAGLGFLTFVFLPALIGFLTQPIPLTLLVLLTMITAYALIDPSTRKSLWFIYKNSMRWITSFFVKIDPISILNKYLAELSANLDNLKKQSAKLRGQMHKMKELIHNNELLIKQNLAEAQTARLNDPIKR